MIKLAVAVGRSADAKTWKNRSFYWCDFVDKMRDPQITHERFGDYMAMSKREQGKIKDVGGYVCGYLNGGRRKIENVMNRSALTLDLDFAPIDFWDGFTMLWDCAAVLHSTHKHYTGGPRFRLIVPLDREVTPDEYIAIARKFAASLNIEYFDPTTFDVNRLMFWPSVSKDGEYIFEEQTGDPLSADDILDMYRDWRDISEWAFSSKVGESVHAARGKKQADPLLKNNIVGYFCSAYDIHQAIEEFIPEVYEPAGVDRYTYVAGSTASGLITYDDKYAYSHHGTDPAGGQLCNAFDLVRIHKFGHEDEDGNISKSYKLMTKFCQSLRPVKKEIAANIIRDVDEFKEQTADWQNDPFEKPKPKKAINAPGDVKDVDDWRELLDIDKFNKYENSAHNVTLILRNDYRLEGRMRYDLFSTKKYTTAPFPWTVEKVKYPRTMRDVDFSGLRNYIERVYNITTPGKIDDAVALELYRNSFHPVRDYLDSLEWDGVPRIDRLLIDCFNARDDIYVREVSRKWLVAAVARVMDPGCKYDTVITIVGEEGTRKSSFFRLLALDWFSDSLSSVSGKEAYEQLLGKWIIELAELSALDKAESVAIKHFLAKCFDSFRPAYGRETVDYLRQCVFTATSNNRTFLRDAEGNRRFWPIDTPLPKNTGGKLDPMGPEFAALIPQIWAEAVVMWQLDEPLILSPEAEEIAELERAGHVELDERRGLIERYLNLDVPDGWSSMIPEVRLDFVNNPETYTKKGVETYKRRYICTVEIWCECFGRRKEDLNQRATREINGIMRTISHWTYRTAGRAFPYYGKQRYYEYIE